MWCCFRSSPTGGSSSSSENVLNKLNVDEEYMEALKTKSYQELWNKVQEGQPRKTSTTTTTTKKEDEQEKTLSSLFSLSPPSSMNLCDHVLEPPQEYLIDIINGCIDSNDQLRRLLIDYFECSLEACKICGFLLRNINQTRVDYSQIQRISNRDYSDDQCKVMFRQLSSFATLSNPISNLILLEFESIHDRYELMFQQLTGTQNKIEKRKKLIRLCKKTAGIGLVITCSAVAVGTLIVAAHTLVGIVASPAVISVSLGIWKKKMKSIKMGFNTSVLCKVEAQIDAATKGVYILNRDFDTVNRLVIRLHNEIAHGKYMAKMCVRNQNRQMLMEVVREFKMNESGFLEQLGELEEHVYLCVLTINRSRRLVLQEIMMHPQGYG